jgi:CO dehydrogenase maturation factor
LQVEEDNPVYQACVRRVGPVRLAVAGPLTESDVGVACYHGKLGAVELLLSHLVDDVKEYVVVDMTAGADTVASGLFARFDLVVVACEPTQRSVGVFHQVAPHVAGFGVPIVAVGNKVQDEIDGEFLHEQLGDNLLTIFGSSAHVRAGERGDHRPVEELEPANRAALEAIQEAVDAVVKDWAACQARTVELHLRNAAAWGNDRTGQDLAHQVDPGFVPVAEERTTMLA